MERSEAKSYLPAARRAEVAELAEAVAEEYFPGRRVEPERIADKKGITYSYGHYADAFDGLIEHDRGRFHIFCNLDRVEGADTPRARFTVGHELGHFFLDEHRTALQSGSVPRHPSFCEYESRNLAEQEADHFASCLLMPTSPFVRKAKGESVGLPGIRRLASHFGTSLTATAVRYVSLGVKPSAVIKWDRGGYSWKWLSYETRAAGFRKSIESVDQIPPGSATERVLAGETSEKGYVETGATASFWFRFTQSGGYRDVLLVEQAMSLGRFGVLTLLYPVDHRFPWAD